MSRSPRRGSILRWSADWTRRRAHGFDGSDSRGGTRDRCTHASDGAAALVSDRLTAAQRRAAAALILELEPAAAVDLTAQSVELYVRRAFADLRRSVHPEAILGMAALLAQQRIRAMLDDNIRSPAQLGARISA